MQQFTQQRNVLNYWRASIKNERVMGVSIPKKEDCSIPIITRNSPIISAEKAKNLLKLHKKLTIKINTEGKINNKQMIQTEYVLPVLIAPFVYKKIHSQGAHEYTHTQKCVYPIWIYALLNEQGEAFSEYPCPLPPWFAREYLEPAYHYNAAVILGDMSKYDAFLDKNSVHANMSSPSIPHPSNTEDPEEENTVLPQIAWEILYDYAQKLLVTVSPHLSQILTKQGYATENTCSFLLPVTNDTCSNYSFSLIKLLDDLALSPTRFDPLLTRYLTLQPSTEQPLASPLTQLQQGATAHVGQMTPKFPLAKSQRIALHHMLMMMPQEGNILAINGPPGTGKTTLIQSIISSLWVKAAIDKKPPPIIVVSSTNNRAIQNVIDTFDMISNNETDLLSKRWIREITYFGIQLKNVREEDKKDFHYPYCTKDFKGTLNNITALLTDIQIQDEFLKHFNQCFNEKKSSLQEAQAFLHHKMIAINLILQEGLKYACAYSPFYNAPDRRSTQAIHIKIEQLKTKLRQVDEDYQKSTHINQAWVNIKPKIFWKQLFVGILPFLNISQILINFIEEYNLPISPNTKTIESYLKQRKKYYVRKIKQIHTSLDRYQNYLKNHISTKNNWTQWIQRQNIHPKIHLDGFWDFQAETSPYRQSLSYFLDTHLRHILFQYAVHYWEAEWIMQIFNNRKNNLYLGYDRAAKIRAFQNMAMLTPCLVTTMQSGPGFFTCQAYKGQPPEFMTSCIDLLIIDEAGQVHPGYGAGMMALSKRACVIGDNLQLKPITKLSGSVDIGNLKFYQLLRPEQAFHDIAPYGIHIAENSRDNIGNVMKVAQNASHFQDMTIETTQYSERGLLLSEHRRCVPDIIYYCNVYYYDNKILPMRSSNNRTWPAMGYAHIEGLQKTVGNSKKNIIEALSIVAWIDKNQTTFQALYPALSLNQIFGIITPFASQAYELLEALKQKEIMFTDKNVGTVHRFQGGEFPVIIFSPVYSYSTHLGRFFFDIEKNLLNVAVSRAKDHFFVFGDMNIFNPREATPSGFLAQCLFKNPENELLNVPTIRVFPSDKPKPVMTHLSGIREHQDFLKTWFFLFELHLKIQ
jgi:hypothetical protein